MGSGATLDRSNLNPSLHPPFLTRPVQRAGFTLIIVPRPDEVARIPLVLLRADPGVNDAAVVVTVDVSLGCVGAVVVATVAYATRRLAAHDRLERVRVMKLRVLAVAASGREREEGRGG